MLAILSSIVRFSPARAMVAMLCVVFMLTACNEEHPDNKPGAVNNPYPEVSISGNGTITFEPGSAEVRHSIPISFSNNAPADGDISVRHVESSAISGRDFVLENTKVTFAKGERQANIHVRLLNDSGRAGDREFRIELAGANNATLGANVSYAITLAANNDDEFATLTIPEQLTFAAPPAGVQDYSVVLPLSRALTTVGSVVVRTLSGSAIEGEHFAAVTGENCNEGRCEVAIGQSELSFMLPLYGDVNTPNRTLRLQFLAAEGLALPVNRETEVTISYGNAVNPDAQSLMLPTDITLRMPDAARGTTHYPIVIPLTGALPEAAELEWRTVDNSAIADVHFTPVDATGNAAAQFAAGAREWAFELELLHDATLSENVNFELQLVRSDGIELGSQRIIPVEIINTNPSAQAMPVIAVPTERSYHEPMAGEQDYVMRLPLSEAMQAEGSVGVVFVEESAKAEVDFASFDNTVTIPAGATELAIPLTLLHNSNETDDVAFRVELYNPRGVVLSANPEFRVRIVDSGALPPLPQLNLSPNLIRVPTPRGGLFQDVTLYFELSQRMAEWGSVTIRSRNGTAKAGIDFEEVALVNRGIPSGQTELSVPIRLSPTTADVTREFELVFSQPNGLLLPESRTVTVQIDPRDTPVVPDVVLPATNERVTLVAPDPAVAGASKLRRIVLPLTGMAPLAGKLEVFAQNGSAVAGTDFALAQTAIDFMIGANEIVIDILVEPITTAKSFELILLRAENANIPSEYDARTIAVDISPF